MTDIGRIYKTPSGGYPSVTTVLSTKENKEIDEWKKFVGEEEANRILKEAGIRGSHFHDTVEKYLKCETIENDLRTRIHFPQVKSYFDDNFEVIYANEIPLYSTKLRVAGRCDCIAKINGKNYIVDFKTSRSYKDETMVDGYRIQCSVYSHMLEEMYGLKVDRYCIIISNLSSNIPTIIKGHRKGELQKFKKLRKEYYRKYKV